MRSSGRCRVRLSVGSLFLLCVSFENPLAYVYLRMQMFVIQKVSCMANVAM